MPKFTSFYRFSLLTSDAFDDDGGKQANWKEKRISFLVRECVRGSSVCDSAKIPDEISIRKSTQCAGTNFDPRKDSLGYC